MQIENIFDKYFDDAMRIHAICAERLVPDEDAKLLTYMHVKGCESGRGIEYFTSPAEVDAEAIGILLGNTDQSTTHQFLENSAHEPGAQSILALPGRISALDAQFTTDHGIENPLGSELRNRLRLYTDHSYRDNKIALYREHIESRIESFSRERVRKAFRAYRQRKKQEDEELMQALQQ